MRYFTDGVMELIAKDPAILPNLLEAFEDARSHVQDWFYEVWALGHKFFVCENGEDGFTAMLPEEY